MAQLPLRQNSSGLFVDHGSGPRLGTLEHACTIVEWRTILRHQLGGAARRIHLGLGGALPRCAPPHAEASHVEANTRVACHCTVAGVEGGDGLALVDWLDTLIWELAKSVVCTVEVANLLGQAIALEESLDVCITGGSWQWSAQAALGPLDTLLVINVACTPLVGDWVALCQALVHIEAVWDLCNAHDAAIVMVLARTLEADNLIVQCHLLALCIAGLLPVCPAGPHPAVSAVASTRVVCNWALARESWDGEAVWPLSLANGEFIKGIIIKTRLMFLDVCTPCSSNCDDCKSNGPHGWGMYVGNNQNL